MQIRKQNELIFSEKRAEIENHTLSKFTRKIAIGTGWSLSLAEYEYSLRNTGTSLPKSV